MKCRINITSTAKEDLHNIAIYIAEQAKDRSIAMRFVRELQEKCKILEQFPESGFIPKDRVLTSFGYRYLIHKEYLVFYYYEKEENTAYILAIFNAKRDYKKVMRNFT